MDTAHSSHTPARIGFGRLCSRAESLSWRLFSCLPGSGRGDSSASPARGSKFNFGANGSNTGTPNAITSPSVPPNGIFR